MQSFLTRAWDAVRRKLGLFANTLESLARDLDIAVQEGHTDKALRICDEMDARLDEMDEATAAGRELTAHTRRALADGRLDLVEAGTGALKAERFIDELEDVVTGHDEDDETQTDGSPS